MICLVRIKAMGIYSLRDAIKKSPLEKWGWWNGKWYFHCKIWTILFLNLDQFFNILNIHYHLILDVIHKEDGHHWIEFRA
jgi:hypothetical protein